MREAFRKFARAAADAVGSPVAFLVGVIVTCTWFAAGPYFHYSDTWQLVINTGTSIGTFLTVFLILYRTPRTAKPK
jgi:low affinity Fe/Cu permease